MLSTLKESYEEFKKRHNYIKIGCTKFTMLMPKHFFFQLGSSDSFCMCVYYSSKRKDNDGQCKLC